MQDQNKPDTEKTAPMNIQAESFSGEMSVMDDETIYRSVQCIPQFFRWGENDEIKVSASAFNDRNFEPSFYRKKPLQSATHQPAAANES